MAFKLEVTDKLPFLGRKAAAASKAAAQGKERAAAPEAASSQASGPVARPLPLIGRLASGRQLQVLIGLLVVLLAIDAAVVAVDTRQGTFGTIYIATAGKIRMLSQRLAKAAQQASQGNREAFKQLRESRDEFAALVNLLLAGGPAAGVTLPPTTSRARPALDALDAEWKKSERNAALVIAEEQNLLALGQSVRSINASNPTLQELADEAFADLLKKHGVPIDLKDALRKSASASGKPAAPKRTPRAPPRKPST